MKIKSRKTKTLVLVILLALLILVACSDSTMPSSSEDTIPLQSESATSTSLKSAASSMPSEASMSPSSVQESSMPEHSQPQESVLSSTSPESNINPDIKIQNSDESPVMSSPEAYALHEQWERNGYPNDVGGVYFDDSGILGFLLVNPTPERVAELRSITGDNIIITQCKYSYNELQKVQGEITAEMKPSSKIYFVGIGFIDNEFRVTVGVDESEFSHYSNGLLKRYDDMVFVEISEQATTGR